MYYFGHMGFFGGFSMIIFWVGFAVLVIWLVKQNQDFGKKDSFNIINDKYTKREINKK